MNSERAKVDLIEEKPVESNEDESRLSKTKREAFKKMKSALRAALIVGIGAVGSYGAMNYFKEPTPQEYYSRVVSEQSKLVSETQKEKKAELARVKKQLEQDGSNSELFLKKLRLEVEISGLGLDNATDNFSFSFSKEIKEMVQDLRGVGVDEAIAAQMLADYPLGLSKQLMDKSSENSPALEHQVSGFETMGVSSNDMDKILSEDFYPRGTVNGIVGKVTYVDKTGKVPDTYGAFLKDDKSLGERNGKDVTFFRDGDQEGKSKQERVEAIAKIFSHELGHLNDYRHSPDLTPKQRVEFFMDITDSFKGSDLPENDYYVSNISNTERRTNNYIKLNEYWAQLVANYLDNPEEFATVTTKAERELINKWFLRHDAKFNNQQKLAERNKFIEQMK